MLASKTPINIPNRHERLAWKSQTKIYSVGNQLGDRGSQTFTSRCRLDFIIMLVLRVIFHRCWTFIFRPATSFSYHFLIEANRKTVISIKKRCRWNQLNSQTVKKKLRTTMRIISKQSNYLNIIFSSFRMKP